MTQNLNLPTVARVALTTSARDYLLDLNHAADMVQHHAAVAELAERGHWLSSPPRFGAVFAGPGGAYNSPSAQIDGRRYTRIHDEAFAARQDVEYLAWWYGTAALAALRAVLAGQEITARQLELLTLHRHLAGQPSPDTYRPALPEDGELVTGVVELDNAMAAALQPLRKAYSAAHLAEHYYHDVDEDLDDEGSVLTDWQASELADVEHHAAKIPGLLLEYAGAVARAAVSPRTLTAAQAEAGAAS